MSVRLYIKLPGITGEARGDFAGCIEAVPRDSGVASSGSFSFTKRHDSTSGRLQHLFAAGEHIQHAILCSIDGSNRRRMFTLLNVVITSFQTLEAGDQTPIETLTISKAAPLPATHSQNAISIG